MTADEPCPAVERYLDLMMGCLTRQLFIDQEVRDVKGWGWRARVYKPVARLLANRSVRLVRTGGNSTARQQGRDWPEQAETMVGLERLANVRRCVTQVLDDGVSGDLVEAGVWRGGAAIFMRAVLAAHGVGDRKVWLADSFEGLPPPNATDYPADAGLDFSTYPELAVGIDEVRANFARYGLLDDQVGFIAGWFRDTLPTAPVERIAVLRLDADLYESTTDALRALYPKVSAGGYVIIDDYHIIDACRQAVTDFRNEHGIDEKLEVVDWSAVHWRKKG